MKNQNLWKPTKYIYRNCRLMGSRDSNEVGIGSRLITDMVAGLYSRFIPLYVKGKLLDLGCGSVPLFHVYRKYVNDIICVDWENTIHKNKFLDFECDITKKLIFKDGEFDTIILSDVLEHIPNPEFLWTEMARILSPNGIIIINVPFLYWIHEKPYDYFRFTEFALRHYVNTSNLKLLQLEAIGGFPELMADLFGKFFQYIPLVGKILSISIQTITKIFIQTNLGNRLSKKSKPTFPLGYFLIVQK